MSSTALEEVVSIKSRSTDAPASAASHVRPVVRRDAPPAEERSVVRKGQAEATAEAPRANNAGEGGFAAVRGDLERRSREWSSMVRLLDQHSQHFEAAERERDSTYEELASAMPIVQESARELKAAIAACRAGELGADLAALFAKNGAALEQLEKVATALNAHFLWCRSAWEQYARTMVAAQRLRADAHRNPSGS